MQVKHNVVTTPVR